MVKKRARWAAPNTKRLLPHLQSPDEEVRGDAVRGLCPCHAGWEAFEGHVSDVLRMLRDPSRGVRTHALHVLEDAARMQLDDEYDYGIREAEAMTRRKRASRFRPQERRLEMKHKEEIRRCRRPR